MRRTRLIVSSYLLAPRLLVVALAAHLLFPSSAVADVRVIDPDRSTITLRVAKSGLFRAFADNHVVQAPVKEGSLDDGPNSRVEIVVEAQRLRVVDPGLSASNRDQVQTRMLGAEVLDVTRFPQIRFRSTRIERLEPDAFLVRGELTLHGQTHAMTVKVASEQGHYRGTASLKQTEFGMTPISVAGGAVTVKDEVQIEVDIVARPAPELTALGVEPQRLRR